MDGLTLLSEGRAAGLIVLADGGRLVIRGPRSADAVARQLLAHKAVVLAAMAADDGSSCPWEAMEPGTACPKCGSLEQWQDLLGRQRCGVCEADALGRALKLAERAARLRTQAQPRKPAPRLAPGCVPVGSTDTLDLGDKRPTQGRLRGLCGV
jgi:hypothetical protein